MTASRRRSRLLTACAALLAAGGLAGVAACGDTETSARADTGTGSAATLTVQDPWAKAADSGMTAVFGTFGNPTDREIVVVSATSTAAARVELHETAMVDGTMSMRQKQGGFQVPAHGTHDLKPGGDHLMLMDLTGPVQPGAEVGMTLTLADGSTVAFTAVAKDFAGGNESYQPEQGGSGAPVPGHPSGSMSMGG